MGWEMYWNKKISWLLKTISQTNFGKIPELSKKKKNCLTTFEELKLALLHLYKTRDVLFQCILEITYLLIISLGNKYT